MDVSCNVIYMGHESTEQYKEWNANKG